MKISGKILSVLLTAVMLLSAMPVMSSAKTPSRLYVGGVKIETGKTSYWKNDGKGSVTQKSAGKNDYNVKYEAKSGKAKLTLKNAVIQKAYTYENKEDMFTDTAAVFADGALEIVLEGSSKIISPNANTTFNEAVLLSGSNTLTVTGNGTLYANAGNAKDASVAIDTQNGSLNISGGAKLVLEGGKAYNCFGISNGNRVTVEGASVSAKSAKGTTFNTAISTNIFTADRNSEISAVSSKAPTSYGISAAVLTVNSNAKLKASGNHAALAVTNVKNNTGRNDLIYVNRSVSEKGASRWNGSDILGVDKDYKSLFGFVSFGYDLSAVKLGDVNRDGAINSSDALLVLQHTVGLSKLDSTALKAADTSKDGKINSSDALLILQFAVGKISKF